MKLPRIVTASRFCCDCGEEVTAERRARWGGARCRGCRALRGSRPGLARALALTLVWAAGFGLGRLAEAPRPAAPALPAAGSIPAAAAPAPPPPEPMRPCGARTKKGTKCKRTVRGEGPCWQHAPPGK